jgi:serine/threonine protein kinase/tetratricopeptide (TPR) repeat protein
VTTSRWERLQEIFHRALAAAPEERPALLDRACGDDDALRREVAALLRGAEGADQRLGRAVAEAAIDLTGPSEPDLSGALLGPYRVAERLGEGGMGEVYLAEQIEPVRRRVALKTIKRGMDTRDVLRRFESERHALERMSHPSIARVLDAGTTPDGRPYFVMDLVTGPPITEYCDRNRLPVARRLALFLEVVAAVQHAHLQGIVHRDLKPSNVLVEEHGGVPVPKIIDFGIAKAIGEGELERTLLTAAGHLIGTPAYMSPEQAGLGAAPVDTRTDVYSLGVLLYELLVGAPPLDPQALRASAYEEMRRMIREVEPQRPSLRLAGLAVTRDVTTGRGTELASLRRTLRGDLDWITLKALEKDPARRYTTPSELAADIRRYFGHEAVQAGPPTLRYRARKFVRRHRTGVTAAALVAASLVAGVVGTTLAMFRASQAEREARRSAETANQTTAFLEGLFRESYPSRARGRAPTAREILDRGARRIDQELGDQPRVRARLAGIIGDVYREIGEYDEAASLLRESVSFEQRARPPDSLALANAYNRLGILMRVTGRRDSARALLEKALGIRERGLDSLDLDLAASCNNLANLYAVSGDFDRAIPLARRALAIRERRLPANDPQLGASYSNIGTMLSETGNLEGARPYYERNLRIQETQPGPESPGLAAAVYNLAGLEHQMEHWDKARALYERALALLERVYAPDHAEVSSALLNIGSVAAHQGDFGRAESVLARASSIRIKVFGADSPMRAKVLRAQGELWRREGKRGPSRRAFERALRDFDRRDRADSLETATTLLGYATCLEELSDGAAARAALGRALAIREAILPPDDSRIAEARSRLAPK